MPWFHLPLRCLALPCLTIAASLLAGCQKGSPGVPAGAGGGGPAVGVTTVAARQVDLPVSLAATGTVIPLTSVDVRPQVSSVIARVHIREGQFVRAGELLFTLDARADEANVAKAQAQMVRDEAALADARRQLARSRELLAQNFIAQGQVDANQATVDAAAALVEADRAALAAARVALGFSRITAPSAGRVGAISVYPGSAVQANQTTLATITQLDPIAVAFSLPQRHLADALAALPGGGAPVTARLPDAGLQLHGRLTFVDSLVDASTGTVKVKAVFDNRDGQLWPGAFVNVAMTARVMPGAVMVPQTSVIPTARGDIVYVVQDRRAAARPVRVMISQGEEAAVEGVRPGERIVVDGRQNLRNGVAVEERPVADGAPSSAPAPARQASTV
jgi:RND family efflux transporter MFP subunit